MELVTILLLLLLFINIILSIILQVKGETRFEQINNSLIDLKSEFSSLHNSLDIHHNEYVVKLDETLQLLHDKLDGLDTKIEDHSSSLSSYKEGREGKHDELLKHHATKQQDMNYSLNNQTQMWQLINNNNKLIKQLNNRIPNNIPDLKLFNKTHSDIKNNINQLT